MESYESDDVYISSLNDVAARIKKYDGQDMAIEYFVKGSAALFATPRVYKYEIGASGKITTALYFEGKVPSCVEFGTKDKGFGSIPDGCYISDGMIEFNEGNSYYVFFWSFDNGSFSGSGYSFQKNELLQPSECGSISGSYVAEGTGCSGCTVTITFTDKPADIKSFTTGTPYVLNQHILGSDRLNYQ